MDVIRDVSWVRRSKENDFSVTYTISSYDKGKVAEIDKLFGDVLEQEGRPSHYYYLKVLVIASIIDIALSAFGASALCETLFWATVIGVLWVIETATTRGADEVK